MTTPTTAPSIPTAWIRAMARAEEKRLSAIKVNDRLYIVRSSSHPGTHHPVTLDEHGKIAGPNNTPACDCLGAQHGRICQHQGALARRLLRERAIKIRQPAPVKVEAVESGCHGRSQMFQEEEVA